MKIITVSVIALFSASAALILGFVIKTIIDYRYYTHSANSAPFGLWIAVNTLYLIVPAVILAAVALLILRKTFVLCICGCIFLDTAIISVIVSGNFLDGLIYAIPAALAALFCGIFALISRSLLAKT